MDLHHHCVPFYRGPSSWGTAAVIAKLVYGSVGGGVCGADPRDMSQRVFAVHSDSLRTCLNSTSRIVTRFSKSRSESVTRVLRATQPAEPIAPRTRTAFHSQLIRDSQSFKRPYDVKGSAPGKPTILPFLAIDLVLASSAYRVKDRRGSQSLPLGRLGFRPPQPFLNHATNRTFSHAYVSPLGWHVCFRITDLAFTFRKQEEWLD